MSRLEPKAETGLSYTKGRTYLFVVASYFVLKSSTFLYFSYTLNSLMNFYCLTIHSLLTLIHKSKEIARYE